MEKKEIRREIKQAILALSPAEREQQSRFVAERVNRIIVERRAQVVALFAPLSDEVQILSLASMLPSNCQVVLPRVEDCADGTPSMEFYDYVVSDSALEEGSYGIMEPQGEAACAAEDIDLMVVPGVAFTREGIRLGRGKGYYDRYLAREGFRAYTVGVCYACQMRDVLPCDEYDMVVDRVVYGQAVVNQ